MTLAAFEAVAPLPLAWSALSAMRGRPADRRSADAPPAVSEPALSRSRGAHDAPLLELRELRFRYPGDTGRLSTA